ncbi:hypothetical protein, partial [Candidatus Frankia nodulisporulans]|uniref:hypothetical protein n=1 Tax=Candidatus Frankia nodulisporulans TaxID=2060052 RepID=UPI0013D0AD16
ALHRPIPHAPEQFTYAWNNGGHLITGQGNNTWYRFDAQGGLAARRTDALGLNGMPDGTVEIDLIAGAGRHVNAGGLQRDWNTLSVEPNGGNIRLGNAMGERQHIAPNGRIVEELVAPRDGHGNPGLTRIHAQPDGMGNITVRLLYGDTVVPNTRVDLEGTGYRVVDTSVTEHADYWRTFGPDGSLRSEKISYLLRDGSADGTYLQIDYAGNTWTWMEVRAAQDIRRAGQAQAIPHGQQGLHGYNSGGSVTVKANGDLQLVGADRTPFYWRERLGPGTDGQRPILEIFRGSGGGRYWHQWSATAGDQLGAHVARGSRTFEDLPEGRLWKDYRHGTLWDPAVREYRTAADKGMIRAERQPDGSWRWYRYNERGALTLTGLRDHLSWGRGWRDIPSARNAGAVAQRYWSAFNFFPDALHYREHAVSGVNGGGFRASDAYKEFSPQIKDTGTREILQNNHTLETVRWAEQRPPQLLWKNLGTVDFHTS